MKIHVSDKTQDLIVKISVFIILYLVFAKPIFNWLGITKSKGDRIRDKELSNPESPFKTTYWKRYYQYPGKTTGKVLSSKRSAELKEDAKKIYQAFGYFTDDEADISGAFYDCKSKAEVSIMSYYFTQGSGQADLLTYLAHGKDLMPQNGLGDYDLQIIISYVDSLKAS